MRAPARGNDPSSGAAVITPTVPVAGATSGQTPSRTQPERLQRVGAIGSRYYGALVNGAKVTLTDTSSGCTVKRTMTTNSSGKLADTARPTVNDPGIPYGTYNVCVSGPEGLNGTIRKVTTNNVVVQDPANPKALTVYLYDGQNGACRDRAVRHPPRGRHHADRAARGDGRRIVVLSGILAVVQVTTNANSRVTARVYADQTAARCRPKSSTSSIRRASARLAPVLSGSDGSSISFLHAQRDRIRSLPSSQ